MNQSKTILITGASRGIGFLTAKALAERGHRVYASMRNIHSRNQATAGSLRDWAQSKNVFVEPIELDVTSEDSVNKALNVVESQGALDVLVNNAGIMPTGLTESFTVEQTQEYFDINLFGIQRTCRAALPAMRSRRSGLIINLSSAAGRLAMPFFGIYCASKWALEAYTESLHYELQPFGIESILVEPSGHGTDLVNDAPAPSDHERTKSYGSESEGRDRLLNMFRGMFDLNTPETDANNVAQAIVNLIEKQQPRPIRTQVGHDMGVSTLNAAVAPIQASLIQELLPIYSTGSIAE